MEGVTGGSRPQHPALRGIHNGGAPLCAGTYPPSPSRKPQSAKPCRASPFPPTTLHIRDSLPPLLYNAVPLFRRCLILVDDTGFRIDGRSPPCASQSSG